MAIEAQDFATEWNARGGAKIKHPLGEYDAENKQAVTAFYAGVRLGLDLAKVAMDETVAAASREQTLNG